MGLLDLFRGFGSSGGLKMSVSATCSYCGGHVELRNGRLYCDGECGYR